MTTSDRMQLFKKMFAEKGQAQVARDLGCSAAVVHGMIRENYKGRWEPFLEKVAEVYGTEIVDCPVLGEITLKRCSRERKTAFSAASPLRVQLFRACKECRRRQ